MAMVTVIRMVMEEGPSKNNQQAIFKVYERMNKSDEEWTLIVKPKKNWVDLHLKDLWNYRDLIMLFVKRDFIAVYKQTVLGPLWYLIQPILTAAMYSIVFGKIANISTAGLPPFVFYLSGTTLWNYFAESFNKTSNTFIANAHIFGKVYFPRLTVPISIIISNLIAFTIQFLLFISVLLYHIGNANIHPNKYMLLLPLLVLIMAGIGLGMGIIISSLTTKYRDLRFLITFGIQLLMFATPVIYPLSSVLGKKRLIILANPISSVVETFRIAFTGVGLSDFKWMYLGYSFFFMIVVMVVGIVLFNRIEKSFMDTV
jgi:lipopolysaccharide transport system permease protein